MHTRRELTALAERKRVLLGRIHTQRQLISQELHRVLEPVRLIDEGLALWRLVSGFFGKP